MEILKITLKHSVPKGKNINDEKNSFQSFLMGGGILPHFIISKLNISIYHSLFVRILNKNYAEIRQILLLIIIEKCKVPDNLESIGGISFFRHLLVSVDPFIALYVIYYILY